jgi:hypothetical protein
MTTEFSETGRRYQLILRGECGPLTEWLFGDAAIETGKPCTSLMFSARDDSELHGLLARIQDPALHLIGLYEIGGTEAVPHPPVRAGLARPGLPPIRPRDPITPPWGPAVLPARQPGHRPPGSGQRQASHDPRSVRLVLHDLRGVRPAAPQRAPAARARDRRSARRAGGRPGDVPRDCVGRLVVFLFSPADPARRWAGVSTHIGRPGWVAGTPGPSDSRVFSVTSTAPIIGTAWCSSSITWLLVHSAAIRSSWPTPCAASAPARRRHRSDMSR